LVIETVTHLVYAVQERWICVDRSNSRTQFLSATNPLRYIFLSGHKHHKRLPARITALSPILIRLLLARAMAHNSQNNAILRHYFFSMIVEEDPGEENIAASACQIKFLVKRREESARRLTLHEGVASGFR